MSKYSTEERKVPYGWSIKGEGRNIYLTSPAGKTFKGRRLAFEYMINSGRYSVTEINEMKSSLKHEGWEKNGKLPRGWMLKEQKGRGPKLLGLGGELFDSIHKAANFMKKYEKYFRQEDLDKIQDMCEKSNLNKSFQVIEIYIH